MKRTRVPTNNWFERPRLSHVTYRYIADGVTFHGWVRRHGQKASQRAFLVRDGKQWGCGYACRREADDIERVFVPIVAAD